MPTVEQTSKGQITIPPQVRSDLDLNVGGKVDFVLAQESFAVAPLCPPMSSLKGRFAGRSATPVTLAMMDAALASG